MCDAKLGVRRVQRWEKERIKRGWGKGGGGGHGIQTGGGIRQKKTRWSGPPPGSLQYIYEGLDGLADDDDYIIVRLVSGYMLLASRYSLSVDKEHSILRAVRQREVLRLTPEPNALGTRLNGGPHLEARLRLCLLLPSYQLVQKK